MRRKVILLAIFVCLLACGLSTTSFAAEVKMTGVCGESVSWTLYADGQLTISGSGDMADYAMGTSPFGSFNSEIKNVVIEDGVTSIGDYAFYGITSLIGIEIPESVTSIGDSAFRGCWYLNNVILPSKLTSIGNYAFRNCRGLDNMTIPYGVVSIGDYTFYNCYSLDSIILPNSITSIGDYAFYDCSSLNSITLPASVTEVGKSSFGLCFLLKKIEVDDSNTAYTSVDGVLYNKEQTKLVAYPNNKSDLHLIPRTVTTIGEYAFSNNDKIHEILIPNTITTISEFAFYNCKYLTDVLYCGSESQWNAIDIQSDNDNLLNAKIHYCIGGICGDNLSWLFYDSSDKPILRIFGTGDMYDFVGIDTPWIKYIDSIHSILIDIGTTSIGRYAFDGCINLNYIRIPHSVTSIGAKAFGECNNLSDVYYMGSISDWNEINISDEENDALLNAKIFFEFTIFLSNFSVTNLLANEVGATIAIPSDGWKIGENTFSIVNSTAACYVAVSYDGGTTYSRVKVNEVSDSGASFTVNITDANTKIVVGAVGDLNNDSTVAAQDARLALQASSGMIVLTPLQQIAADLNRDGKVSAQEARLILQASSKMYELEW